MEIDCIKVVFDAFTMDSLKYAMLCIRPNNEWILIHFLIRTLGGCQTYNIISLENERLYACETL